ncbi:T9SS type B sorting domain-containing protein [Flavihumibacter profundi]|uniref:T9SS type B sorting domain-containing protein n=1 Tax=Flavihumibacter profundi TaxID=2716883 RepID=UPI001CC75E48|nr:gliding motility-associated C-terminal domain-containing protein [Flavihumibacter profundi]MBZ5856371.1 gliding motility-associated C-terminal domain-containing protein [Flavihumibacter profundi]
MGEQSVVSFTAPDTVCVNTPINIVNTSSNVATSYWSFCSGDLNSVPTATNLGNPGGYLDWPVFMDYVFDNGKYYAFVTNYRGGNILRLDFGNSLLNTPTPVNITNLNGVIPPGDGAECIQVVFNEGKWYGIMVAGYPPVGYSPRIVKIEFGANIENVNPLTVDWGNIGNLLQPIDLNVFQDGGNWYGLTVNAENNTITRFNFTNSFDNIPTATNLGNIGGLEYPTSIFPINDNGNWKVFITNAGNNTTTSGNFSLSRLDFGSSLLNTPTGVNLGNPGNILKHPRDITILRTCGETVGFSVNGMPGTNDLVKLDFHNDLNVVPEATSFGNIGGFDFPHSISKIFRIGTDLFCFVTNVRNNTISRIRFAGCNNSSIQSSNAFTPPAFSYAQPGKYTVNLFANEGLPNQGTFCKQITVVAPPATVLGNDTSICKNSLLQLNTLDSNYKVITWSTGEKTSLITVKGAGKYWVDVLTKFGCAAKDTIQLSELPVLSFSLGTDTSICANTNFRLNGPPGADSYLWSNGNSSNTIPVTSSGNYVLQVTSKGCISKDSIDIVVKNATPVNLGIDTFICKGKTIMLDAGIYGENYRWNTGDDGKVIQIAGPGDYSVSVTNNGCVAADTIKVLSRNIPIVDLGRDITICEGQPVSVQVKVNDGFFSGWLDGSTDQVRTITQSGTYIATALNSCGTGMDSILIFKGGNPNTSLQLPNAFTPNNDGKNECFGPKSWGAVTNYSMIIFNRFGQQVFTTERPDVCWDGTFKGIKQPNGTYVYIVRGQSGCGLIDKKGIVNLLR